jgi:hypothetical protein
MLFHLRRLLIYFWVKQEGVEIGDAPDSTRKAHGSDISYATYYPEGFHDIS